MSATNAFDSATNHEHNGINGHSHSNGSQLQDDTTTIILKDTPNAPNAIQYDIDNLPIQTVEKPILSLKKLRESTKDLEALKDEPDPSTSKKKGTAGKYSNFFVKNFFLKKDDHKPNDTQNDTVNTAEIAPSADHLKVESVGTVRESVSTPSHTPMTPMDEHKSDEHLHRIKVKGNTKEKEMSDLRLTQKIQHAHKGAIYCMEFSKKGDYLATGGQDSVLRIWTVCGSTADRKRWRMENDHRSDVKSASAPPRTPATPNNGGPNDHDHGDLEEGMTATEHTEMETETSVNTEASNVERAEEEDARYQMGHKVDDVLSVVAYREFTGHRADIIDISWSNGEFILSASIDQTVMLWHTSRTRCLCLFQHSDIVTSVQFHPNEDYLFLSGSFDSRLRLWNILEHRVVDWV